MKKIFTLLSFYSIITFAQQEKYVGVGFQKNSQDDWKIEVTKISNNIYEVNYPDDECSGTWTVLEKANTYFLVKEKITFGQDKCIDGYVKIYDDHFAKNAKRFYFFEQKRNVEPYAFGFLQKLD